MPVREVPACSLGVTVLLCVVQATPANWPYNHDSIGKKGWAFLLPTVTPEDAKTHFPDHHSCKVRILMCWA